MLWCLPVNNFEVASTLQFLVANGFHVAAAALEQDAGSNPTPGEHPIDQRPSPSFTIAFQTERKVFKGRLVSGGAAENPGIRALLLLLRDSPFPRTR